MKNIINEKRIYKFECTCWCDFETDEYELYQRPVTKSLWHSVPSPRWRPKQKTKCPGCCKDCYVFI